jgi:predicted MFS family arabinose efflux permease
MPLGRALRYVLRVQTNVVLIVATASGYFFFAGLRTFGVVFARGHFGLSQSMASTLFTLIGLGALAGVLSGGRLADAWMRRGRANARVSIAIVGYLAAALVLPAGPPHHLADRRRAALPVRHGRLLAPEPPARRRPAGRHAVTALGPR